jgi:hypothetical protein
MQRSIFLLFVLITMLAPLRADARPFRVNQIPNGSKNSCLNCHFSLAGGVRNPFGAQIESGFLDAPGSSGNVLWGPELAALNADADGASNGAELLDPLGEWHVGLGNPGAIEDVTNPGVVDVEVQVPALDSTRLATLVALIALLSFAYLHRQRDRNS